MIRNVWTNLQLLSFVFWQHIALTGWVGSWLLLSGLIIFILQWLFNLETLQFVLFESGFGVGETISYLSEGWLNVFRFADDITPVSFILIAVLQATAVILLLKMRQSNKKQVMKQTGALGLGLLGAGCVACGGSLLTPLLAFLASSVSVALAERLGEVLLLIAVVLSYRVAVRSAEVYARLVVHS